MTKNNLGVALSDLVRRMSGTGKLDEAVDAYREALKAAGPRVLAIKVSR
jgi:hypothetical protein